MRLNALAQALGAAVEAHPDFELMAPVSLSVVCFRYRPREARLDEAALDRLNEAIAQAISATGEAHAPGSKIGERSILRACFLHYENDVGDVDHLMGLVARLGRELVTRY